MGVYAYLRRKRETSTGALSGWVLPTGGLDLLVRGPSLSWGATKRQNMEMFRGSRLLSLKGSVAGKHLAVVCALCGAGEGGGSPLTGFPFSLTLAPGLTHVLLQAWRLWAHTFSADLLGRVTASLSTVLKFVEISRCFMALLPFSLLL